MAAFLSLVPAYCGLVSLYLIILANFLESSVCTVEYKADMWI